MVYGGVPCHRTPTRTRPGMPEWPSGLNGLAGLRVAYGSGAQGAPRLLYLRSFWPGSPDPLQGVWDNRWIGSRSRPAWAGLDVSDLECLTPRCGRAGSGDGGAGSGTVGAGSGSFVAGSVPGLHSGGPTRTLREVIDKVDGSVDEGDGSGDVRIRSFVAGSVLSGIRAIQHYLVR